MNREGISPSTTSRRPWGRSSRDVVLPLRARSALAPASDRRRIIRDGSSRGTTPATSRWTALFEDGDAFGSGADSTPAAVPHAMGHPGSEVSVLLVEDHEPSRAALTRLLRSRGYKVVGAGTVAAALRAAQEQAFGLIVSDIGLPDGNGYELLRQLRTKFRSPAIAVTGYGTEQDVQRAKEAGYAVHLTKPITIEKLYAALAAVLPPS